MQIFSIQNKSGLPVQVICILLAVLVILAAYLLDRNQTLIVFSFWTAAVIMWLTVLQFSEKVPVVFLFFIAVFCRIAVWFAFPNLSEDIYRFIWDGALWMQGVYPFSMTPEAFMHLEKEPSFLLKEVYPHLNSPAYHSVYPAFCQAFFAAGAYLFPKDVFLAHLVIKLPLLLAEVFNLWLLLKLLQSARIAKKCFAAYALQPFIILEGVGNAHFEVLMLTPLFLLIYFYNKRSAVFSGSLLALAASVKLVPGLFMPLLFFKQEKKRWLLVLAFAVVMVGLHFFLLQPYELWGFASSIDLYFRHFEFNASIYYLVRLVLQFFTGYNAIAYIGPLLAISSLIVIVYLSHRWKVSDQKSLAAAMLVVLLVYYLGATTVHPWYIITLAGLAVFGGWYFPWVWLCMAWLSYLGYHPQGYQEIWGIIILQYTAVFIALYFDIRFRELLKLK